MSPDEIKAAINAAIEAKVILTYTQLFAFVLIIGAAAFFGSYIKKRGKTLQLLKI
jgi:hypothetical protein